MMYIKSQSVIECKIMTFQNQNPPAPEIKRQGIFYGYIIVLASMVFLFLLNGVGVSFGVFFNPLQNEFGWNRTIISSALSMNILLGGLFGIITGRLIDRFGPRVIIAASAIILGAGYLAMSRMQTVWQFYLFYGVIIAIGGCSGDISTLSTTARWFIGRRGIMSGLVKVGTGIGILFVPLAANWLISNYGWRQAYVVLGLACAIGIFIIALFFRRDPVQYGLKPFGSDGEDTGTARIAESGVSFHEAIVSKQFWMVSGLFFLIDYCANSVLTHITPHALDIGLSSTTAASMLSVLGGTSIFGRLAFGFTGDKIGSRRALVVCFAVFVATLVWLQFAGNAWMLYLFTAVYGFAHGGFYSLVAPLIAELFGTKAHGVIFGVMIFFASIGGATGPAITGLLFDMASSYRLAFLILAGVSFAGLILSTLLKPMNVER
jgi:MFS family permease